MRIAILTLPLHTNFGGILQCYALQTVLERMGHEVSVLNTDFVDVNCKTRIGLFIKRLAKTILRKESRFYGWKTEREIPRQHTQAFIDKYIHIRNIKDLSLLTESEFDAIIVGSDQIWRPIYYRPIANAYLKFAKDWKHIRRIAYAASFGTDVWEYTQEETTECASLLRLFDFVSVRESSGVELCRKYLNVKAVQTLDPTLLLLEEDYIKLIGRSNVERHEGGLFCYFLDEMPGKIELANRLAEKYGLGLYRANNAYADDDSQYFEKRIQSSLEQWIAGFRDASFVVTDSFHGCVFSIIFHKHFLVMGNSERGLARFVSLLSLFDLQERFVDAYVDIIKMNKIDYVAVDEKLKLLRYNSQRFLENGLS